MPPFSIAIKSAMTNKFTRTGVSQPRFPDSSALTMPPFPAPLANLGEDAAVLALPKESSVLVFLQG